MHNIENIEDFIREAECLRQLAMRGYAVEFDSMFADDEDSLQVFLSGVSTLMDNGRRVKLIVVGAEI